MNEIQGSGVATHGKRLGVFEISTPDRRYLIDAGDGKGRRDWLTTIKEIKAKRSGKSGFNSAPSPQQSANSLPFGSDERGGKSEHATFGRSSNFSAAGQVLVFFFS